jgi:hypothetical protein
MMFSPVRKGRSANAWNILKQNVNWRTTDADSAILGYLFAREGSVVVPGGGTEGKPSKHSAWGVRIVVYRAGFCQKYDLNF